MRTMDDATTPANDPTPTVGMGVTYQSGADAYPYTVIRVLSAHTIEVQADEVVRTDGNGYYSESQSYLYKPCATGQIVTLTRRTTKAYPNGRWAPKGKSGNRGGLWTLGRRSCYRDPSF